MKTKSNMRSMRFSDTMIEMIEAQNGDTFTAKFEALVTRCMWELPRKEEQLKAIEKEIQDRRQRLYELNKEYSKLWDLIHDLSPKATTLKNAIERHTENWEK